MFLFYKQTLFSLSYKVIKNVFSAFCFAAIPSYQSHAAKTRNFDLHLPQLGFTQQNK